MMSNNKILTVSYGTFSCTLEGFDDSFGTMKAIAEYFRDLSADDRYFGAEPAQPDAEMLTRIAEREISRRVEAREHDGRIVLSASDAQVAPTQAAPALAGAAALAAQAQTDTPATDHVPAQDLVSNEDDAETADTVAAIVEDNVETPEAHIADTRTANDIDADIAEMVNEDVAVEIEVIEDEAVEDAAEAFFAESTEADATSEEDSTDEEPVIEHVADADEANADDTQADADTQTDVTAEDISKDAPVAADSIAAKLQRIRAVVSQGQNDAVEDELFEDQHAEDIDADENALSMLEMTPEAADSDRPAPADVIADAAHDLEVAAQIDEDQANKAEEDLVNDEDDDLAAMLARLDKSDDAQSTDADDAQPVAKDIPADEDDLGLDTLAALMAADDGTADLDDADENLFDDSIAPEMVEDAIEEIEKQQSEDAPKADDTQDAPEAVVAPRRARIVKVKRADIDAALASGQLEEVKGDEAENTEETTLSAQDEAELLAELAEVETELADVEIDLPEDAADDAEDETITPARVAKVADEDEINDDDVSRLMAEADNQMDEPEGSGRRNAFAHLKAAVMAKKADADIGNDSIKDEGAFRSDLASVVKPRRPASAGTQSERGERPEGPRPAPLKLVAEQRVDVAQTNAGPVRPRRVAAVQEPEVTTDAEGGFADYAADQGAHDLPALLEAAASYLSFVEGRDQFSRPQLMNKVRQVERDEFSREDGLRSFGQLLRAGKIEKTKGGRFAVTGDIGFRPDERAAS